MKFKDMNTPNKLTTIRMCCVPLIIVLFVLYGLHSMLGIPCDYDIAVSKYSISVMQILIFLIFVGASITDFVDGKMARKLNIVSEYGKLMDPLADKLLVNTTLICLIIFNFTNIGIVWLHVLLSIMIVLVIVRDTFVDALRMQALKHGQVVAAKLWGKIKTATLMPGIAILLLGANFLPAFYYIGTILIILGSVFALIGGVDYFKSMKKFIGE